MEQTLRSARNVWLFIEQVNGDRYLLKKKFRGKKKSCFVVSIRFRGESVSWGHHIYLISFKLFLKNKIMHFPESHSNFTTLVSGIVRDSSEVTRLGEKKLVMEYLGMCRNVKGCFSKARTFSLQGTSSCSHTEQQQHGELFWPSL